MRSRSSLILAASLCLTCVWHSGALANQEALRTLNTEAHQAYLAKDYACAARKYNEAIRIASAQKAPTVLLVLWSNLGAVYREDHKYELSEQAFKRAIAIAEKHKLSADTHAIGAMQQYALLLHRLKRDAEAAQLEARATATVSNLPVAAMADDPVETELQAPPKTVQLKGKIPADAIKNGELDWHKMPLPELKDFVAAHLPDEPNAWLMLANRAEECGDWPSARDFYKTIENRWPDGLGKKVHGNCGRALGRTGQWQEASEEWKLAIAARPDDAGGYIELARTYASVGDLDSEIETLEEYVQKFPGDGNWANNSAFLEALKKQRETVSQAANTIDYRRYTWSLDAMPLKVYIKDRDADIQFGTGTAAEKNAVFESTVLGLVRHALNEWTQGSDGKVQFTFVDSVEDSNIYFLLTQNRSEMSGDSAQGVTDFPQDNNLIRRARIRILTVRKNGGTISKGGFLHVVMHELGHAIGMNHTTQYADVMYPVTHDAFALSDGDKEQVRSMYANRSL